MREDRVDVGFPSLLVDDRRLVVVVALVGATMVGERLGGAGHVDVERRSGRRRPVEQLVVLRPIEARRDRSLLLRRTVAEELVLLRPARVRTKRGGRIAAHLPLVVTLQ